MEDLQLWHLREDLTVIEAALLIIGINPSEEDYKHLEVFRNSPDGFDEVFGALKNAIMSGQLNADLKEEYDQLAALGDEDFSSESTIDWYMSTILVDDLKEWLIVKNFTKNFFFPDETKSPGYLNSKHEHYSPKLAAAIRAWEVVSSNPKLTRGHTPKQAMIKWLRKNAGDFELKHEDGKLMEDTINEIARISNWAVKGGAPSV